ncbi:hypothetical protein NP233_g4493 [Leucocoprinus birnbaumii]|uniref:F-box domain-containing protein n=1 Tax=Leucocoprinus birnbaumii TaxID=56174 RepID=A0AAD5VVY8_9AGAR|nr:hypothetical protein NP233_g4493 [Leucocoprinus birnbaumii]
MMPTIHRLPPEILVELFSILLPKGIELPGWFTTSLWGLASVCQKWRNVIFSTPCLWSQFKIIVPEAPRPSFITALQLLLERSGDYPLTFVLCVGGKVPQWSFQEVLSCFLKRAGQWKDVLLTFRLSLLTGCTDLQELCFPQLRLFGICLCDTSVEPHWQFPPPLQLFPHSPLLSQLILLDFDCPPSSLHLPWDQITHLEYHGNVEWLLDILEHTPNLSVLKFDGNSRSRNLLRAEDAGGSSSPTFPFTGACLALSIHFRLVPLLQSYLDAPVNTFYP